MRTHLYTLTILVALGGVALAQKTSQQRDPSAMPQTQQQPTSEQGKSSTDVQNEIQAAFQKEPSLANASINVQVTAQGVDLSGTVPTKDAKDTAEQIAKAHSGGLEVKNRLKVGGAN